MSKRLLLLVTAIFVVAGGMGCYIWSEQRVLLGKKEIVLDRLEGSVKVYFDLYSIPHIEAESERDIARVIGYLQASYRLWQMDLTRRMATGRLAEVFGEDLLPVDTFHRVIGLNRFAKRGASEMEPETVTLIQAYADGVNAWLEEHKKLPFEFRILGYKMEPWRVEDTIAIARYMGWELGANYMMELLRYALIAERGEEVGWALVPKHRDPGPYIVPPSEVKYTKGAHKEIPQNHFKRYTGLKPAFLADLLARSHNARSASFATVPAASNNWAVSGSRSESGKPLLANDPHLDLNFPSVWWEAHIKAGDLEVAGVMFPGTPQIVLGHNRHIAWAATTSMTDVQDLYIERINPNDASEYLYDGSYEKFRVHIEEILCRSEEGMEVKRIEVRESRHGPIINEVADYLPDDAPPIAIRWTGWETSDELKGFSIFTHASNWDEFREAFRYYKVPVQNWVYADVNGNIGYIAGGLTPIRPNHDGSLPVPGDDPRYEWAGFVPTGELPQLFNPRRGFVASANNKVVPPEYPYPYSDTYLPPYRAWRINELLGKKERFSLDDMEQIQLDTYSKQGERIAPHFVRVCRGKGYPEYSLKGRACEVLGEWKFDTGVESAAALIFYEAYRQSFVLTFEDEMSPEIYEAFRERFEAYNTFDNLIEEVGMFFDNRETENRETKDDVLAAGFEKAVEALEERFGDRIEEWRWGEVHTVLFDHPFGQASGIMRRLLSLGPYPLAGSQETINNGYYSYFDKPFSVTLGPSLRHLVDMADVEGARMVITTGQSERRLSPHNRDQVSLWVGGEYRPMLMNWDKIRGLPGKHLTFIPR
ncbi:MAG: penicillin acylase family protein [Deltaproteobacteria bacterium]|nr:MAG: penicillin acylase family protein [Deltaproteobacteria bacterium]